MDSFELNKILGAILGTLLFVMGVGFLAEAIYHPIEGRGPGYSLPEPEGGEQHGTVTEAPTVEPIAVRMQTAEAEAGARVIRKCQSCHNWEEGSANKTGPEIYDIVGRQIAAVSDFAYSDAMAALSDEHWDYTSLDEFLASPRTYVPGTKMTFAGISNPEERADLIAFLRTLSPSPEPLPEPEPEPAAEEAADEDAMMEAETGDASPPEEEMPTATDEQDTLAPEPPQDEAPANQ